MNLRLLEADVVELQKQAQEELVPWQTKVRAIIHDHVSQRKKGKLLL